jgi:PAS domain S-box-containing protein
MLVHTLAVILGVLVLKFVALRGGEPAVGSPWHSVLLNAGTVLVLLSYILVRLGRYRFGLIFYLVVSTLLPLAAVSLTFPNRPLAVLASTLIPILVASVLLSLRWAVAILGLSLVGSAVVAAVFRFSHLEILGTIALLDVVLGVGLLTIVLRRHQNRLEVIRLTSLRASEAAVLESERRVQTLVSNSRDIILVLGHGGRDAISYGAVEAITGYKPGEIGLEAHNSAIDPEDRQRVFAELADVAKAPGRTKTCEWRHRHRDGQLRWLEGVAINHLGEPGVDAIVVNIRDITERRRVEAERQALQDQLQHAVKMESIGRLAGGVAHDFNNLLTAILGNVELAVRRARNGQRVDESLNEIREATLSAAALTRQLLAFSRKQVIAPRTLDANELIGRMDKMLKRLIGEDIRLRTIPGENLGSVRADPGLLEQAIVNLVVNARDAMPNGGSLVIETADLTLDSAYQRLHPGAEPGRYVMLAISDTGVGMSDEVKAHIFEPFFTTKPRGEGTGLGLATTYGAVRQSNGFIDVYSQVGKGATFKIYLPVVGMDAESLTTPSPDDPDALRGGKESILVVEDEQRVRDLVSRSLSAFGYEVLVASSGADAVALATARQTPINLLLTDVIMPGMNGRELAERLTQLHPEMRVLFTSGYTENIIAQHGILEPGIEFLSKPYTLEVLAHKVRRVLDRKSGDSDRSNCA